MARNHAATRISSQEEMHGWDIIFGWLGGTDDSESLAETKAEAVDIHRVNARSSFQIRISR
jgi:hypothetical protein